jgi:transposase-like protein
MKKGKHRTKEEKEALIKNYLESGLSKNAWCRNNNIPISTFNGWEKKINKGSNTDEVIFVSPKPKKQSDTETISPTIIEDNTSNLKAAEFTTILEVYDCKLHINETTPFSFISQLIKTVRESHV